MSLFSQFMEFNYLRIIGYFLFSFQKKFYFMTMKIEDRALRYSILIAGLASHYSHFELCKFFKRLVNISASEKIFEGILTLYYLNCGKDLLRLILISLIHYL